MPRLNARARHPVRFTLNGHATTVEVEPRMVLTDALRHLAGSTGTHVGCEHGVCGACTVQIDGVAARACLTLAVHQDRAGAAHAVLAAHVRPGQPQVVAEEVGEQLPRRNAGLVALPVDDALDGVLLRRACGGR